MKKYLLVVVGIIIGVIGTSYAAYKLKAEQVSFDKNNTGLNSDNIQSAIDELATGILTYGDAEANDILEGKTALVNGQKITGTLKNDNVSLTEIKPYYVEYPGARFIYEFESDYDAVIAFITETYIKQPNDETWKHMEVAGRNLSKAEIFYGGWTCPECSDYLNLDAATNTYTYLLRNVKAGDTFGTFFRDDQPTSILTADLFALEYK